MRAKEIPIEALYSERITYVTPSFQRPYRFSQKAVQALLKHACFLGALVVRELPSHRDSAPKALLMDGNQRLLTLLLLLLALRNRLQSTHPTEATRLQHRFFLDPDSSPPGAPKNIVSKHDRAPFEAAVAKLPFPEPQHPIARAYAFAEQLLATQSQTELLALSQHLSSEVTCVVLTLAPEDDPYPVFRLFNPGNDAFSRRGRAAYTQYAQDPELMDLIAGGESQEVEFKAHSVVRTKNTPDDAPQSVSSIVRAVASLLNSPTGGTLLIGVQDDGSICGVEGEYALVDRGKKNWDGYQLYLANILRAKLDASNAFLHYSMERRPIHGHDVCLIRISPSQVPVYVAKRLYVRTLNQTVEMLGPDLVDYVQHRFP